jgi:hypothetical protein
MARGKRVSKETKMEIGKRFNKGEDAEALAKEAGVSVYSIGEWGRLYKNKRPKEKRTVAQMVKKPEQNTRVSELEVENKRLRSLVEFWKKADDSTITGED